MSEEEPQEGQELLKEAPAKTSGSEWFRNKGKWLGRWLASTAKILWFEWICKTSKRLGRFLASGAMILVGWIRNILKWLLGRPTSSTFWSALATLIIAGATVFYTDYAKKQWQVMSRQAEVMSRQAEVMSRQAEVMSKQAEIMSKQTEITSKQLEADQRPWLYVRDWFAVPARLVAETETALTAVIANGGKTPAFIDLLAMTVDVFEGELPEELPYPPPVLGKGVLFPGQEIRMQWKFMVSTRALNSVTDGKHGIYYYGKMIYRDSLTPDKIHTTRYCYLLMPGDPLAGTPTGCKGKGQYNYAD